MTDLERFLSNRNADADTWVDDEGLHVHDWDTDRCLLFDANEKDFHFIYIYIHAIRTLSVFDACLAEIENDHVAVALELGCWATCLTTIQNITTLKKGNRAS